MKLKSLCINDRCLEVPSPQFIWLSGSASYTIPANGRAAKQINLNPPEGYSFGAYRAVTLSGSGRDSCAIQFFGSAGGGTEANVAIKNVTSSQVTVNVSVTVLFYKES